MLDIKLIRDQTDDVRARLATKGVEPSAIDELLALDDERRRLIAETDTLKKDRNERSKEIGKIMKAGGDADAAREEVRRLGDTIAANDDRLREADAKIEAAILVLPNLPHPAAPIGGEPANKVIREWGTKPTFDGFAPRPHKDLGEALGIFDFDAAAALSGSGFSLLIGAGAALQRGLIRWMIETHTTAHGYTEIAPPFLVSSATMRGTGQLPKFADELYRTADEADDLWLIPTAEVPVTNILAGRILEPGALPVRYCAYTPCFRREAGSYGKDTTGLMRMHQFDKVEMVRFTAPEESEAAHEELTGNAEALLRALGLHYRVLELATRDMSASASRCYDLEVWAPGTGRYLEVSSCSNFGDYQARRANIRFRREAGAKPEFVHTLNGSGLALPRLMIALLETYQQADGAIALPEVIVPFAGRARLDAPKAK
jgi:seryl-tRNA synthetase